MMRILIILLACAAYGQEFEVAEVQVNKLGQPPSVAVLPGGQITLRGIPMNALIQFAYKEVYLDDYIKGGPAWLGTDRFDVVAKGPAGASRDAIRLMFQKLLADRFHLTIHREQTTMPVFVMSVAKGGAKLTESAGAGDPQCERSITPDNVYHRDCHHVTMAYLAEQLPAFAPLYFTGRPVLDMTDLKGAYDFRLDWTPVAGGLAGLQPPQPGEPAQTFEMGGMTIFGTMERNLGLKLAQRKQSMTIIVIDNVDRVPTEN
jgi:uncharacterized protein (TIGR03435 family)